MEKTEVVYGWWEHKRNSPPIPPFVNDERNYTLYAAELAEYVAALAELKLIVGREYERADYASRTLERGRVPSITQCEPHLFTLCDVLEFLCSMGKAKLRLTNFLVASTKRRLP